MRSTLPTYLRIRTHATRRSYDATLPVQRPLRAAYYRGGTSRAVIIHPQDLPSDRKQWPDIFRQLMGSGDPYGRQLDGMGAGISSLSKICLVEAYGKEQSERVVGLKNRWGIDKAKKLAAAAIKQEEEGTIEAHVDYTFVGLGIENDEVDVAGNCGNMSSAIGPYAYNARLLPSHMYATCDGEVTVKIRNTNTQKFIDSTFSVVGGQAAVTGDYTIDGVTGKGSKIKLDFRHPYGSKTGKVLPTGQKVDTVAGYKVTCVDGANPAVFIRADDLGIDGTILPNDFNKLPEKLAELETIRKAAAVAMGLAETEDEVPRTIPKVGIVSMSARHPVLSGTTLKTSQMDLVVRFISDTQPHRAIPLTAALTTAVAARIPGTIVEQLLAPDPVAADAITIGHASGRLQVNATMHPTDKLIPLSATVYRTAKRLFEGKTFWTDRSESTASSGSDTAAERHSLGMAFVLESRGQDASRRFDEPQQLNETDKNDQLPSKEVQEEPKNDIKPFTTQEDRCPRSNQALIDKDLVLGELEELKELVHQRQRKTSKSKSESKFHSNIQSRIDTLTRHISNPEAPTPATENLDPAKGNEWHRWARSLHKRRERLRAWAEREEKFKRTGKKRRDNAHLKLDAQGNLKREKNRETGDTVRENP